MAQYGYSYRTISTYSSVMSNERTDGAVTKPFAPNFSNGYAEGQVSKKMTIPVASRPYEDESNDELKHQRHASPRKFDDFIAKVHSEANRSPPRSTSSPDHRGHSSQPKPYNGYADYGSNNRPIGVSIKHDGYSDSPKYGNKEGKKPLFGGTLRNYDNPDGYGYGSQKPIETTNIKPSAGAINGEGYRSPVKKDNYDHGDGDYGNKEGPKPKLTDSPIYNNRYGGDYDNYNNKDGPKSTLTGNTIYNSGYGGDYGDNNRKEGIKSKPKLKPTVSSSYGNGSYGADYGNYTNKEGLKPKLYSNGYGGDYGNYSNKEGSRPKPKPTGDPVYNNRYGGYGTGGASSSQYDDDDDDDYGNYHNNKEGYKHGGSGPKPTPGWTGKPRKGTQLSKAVNDIGEAMEMLMQEAAMRKGKERGYDEGPQPYEYGNKGNYDKAMNEAERLRNIVISAPQYRPSMSVPIKEETRPNGKTTLLPTRQRFSFNDGRSPSNYDNRQSYGVMDHKEAEKKFNGLTIDI